MKVRTTMHLPSVVTLFLSLFLLGCSSSTDVTGLQPSIAVIYGQVVSEEGDPVPEVFVRALIYEIAAGGCSDDAGWLAGTDRTDAEGEYSILGMYLHVARSDMCVAVEARPEETSGLEVARVVGAEVEFIHQSLTPPVDSVRVDLVLSPED